MDSETVLKRAEEAHLRLVRFMYCDNGGIIRGKATHVNGLKNRMAEGIGQSLAMQAFAGVDALAAVDGMGPVGEFRLVPDPDTFVVLPYAPKTGMMLCDLYSQQDHQPWSACPRTFLKRMIAAAAQLGIAVQASVEHEFYLARETDDGGYAPYDRSLCYSSIGFDSSALIIDDILAALEQEGIQVEQFMPELAPASRNSPSSMWMPCAPRIMCCGYVRPYAVSPSGMACWPRSPRSRFSIRPAVARISISVSGDSRRRQCGAKPSA